MIFESKNYPYFSKFEKILTPLYEYQIAPSEFTAFLC